MSSSNVKRDRLSSMKKKAFSAFNDNDQVTQISQNTYVSGFKVNDSGSTDGSWLRVND